MAEGALEFVESLSAIAANVTVTFGGLYAGTQVLRKLTALVRVSSAQAVATENATSAAAATRLDEWSLERSRVLFTAATDELKATDFNAGRSAEQVRAMDQQTRGAYIQAMGRALSAFTLVLSNATSATRDHWGDVIFAELMKHAPLLRLFKFPPMSPELNAIIEAVKRAG